MSEALKVGYLESWGNITFTEAAEAGYDTLVMAFGTIDGSVVDIYDGKFLPSPTPELLTQDIAEAKRRGAKKVLFSVGGQNNTYNPGESSAADVATSVVNFANKYGFNGIDFDLEIEADGIYLESLCHEIRQKRPDLLITAAPQVNQGDHETDIYIVSTGNFNPYQQALENKYFDYLFIQAYNNPWPTIDGKTQIDVGFISASFINLKNSIPRETLITIGEPASKEAAGTSVYNGPDGGEGVYDKIAEQYDLIRSDEQFGGFMVWDINWDQKNGYQFIDVMKVEASPEVV